MPVHYKGVKAPHVGLRIPLAMLSVRLFECVALDLRYKETAQNPTRTRRPFRASARVGDFSPIWIAALGAHVRNTLLKTGFAAPVCL
jgi:hypothetical protein